MAFPDLDAGESSTLSLARAHRGPRLLLMDEPFGRNHARLLGMEVTGVAGLLVRAKQRGLVATVGPLLDALEARGFRLSGDVTATVLEQAGEV